MDTSLSIWQAQTIARALRKAIIDGVDDVAWADIHLELCRKDIEKHTRTAREVAMRDKEAVCHPTKLEEDEKERRIISILPP